MAPDYNADPILISDWISGSGFPLDEEEKELLRLIKETLYTSEPNNVERLYGLRILYWQTVGWLRAGATAHAVVSRIVRSIDTVEAIKQGRDGVWDEEE